MEHLNYIFFLTFGVEKVQPFFCAGEYLLSYNNSALLCIELLKACWHS